jgi:hypothetical protein
MFVSTLLIKLNPSSGHYGYRSHNFNVIPEKIKALGQKIQTDCTSNALTIHIANDKSTDITTISSALHKRMETSVRRRLFCSNNNGTDDFL